MSFWIGLGAMIKNPVYQKLEVSVANCSTSKVQGLIEKGFTFNNQSKYIFNETVSTLEGIDQIYALSTYLYTGLGALTTLFTGVLISIAFGGLKNKVDSSFILFDLSSFIELGKK